MKLKPTGSTPQSIIPLVLNASPVVTHVGKYTEYKTDDESHRGAQARKAWNAMQANKSRRLVGP